MVEVNGEFKGQILPGFSQEKTTLFVLCLASLGPPSTEDH